MVRTIKRLGGSQLRQKGSHVQMACRCGRYLPVHGKDLTIGTRRAIEKALAPCLGSQWLAQEMEGTSMARYTVRFEMDPDGDGWTVTIPAVRGCISEGDTLPQARRRIREALSLFVEDADEAELVEEIQVPAQLRKKIAAQRQAKQEADAKAGWAQTLLREATADVLRLGLTRRDAARVLGISYQRVQQLAPKTPSSGKRSSPAPAESNRKRSSKSTS